MAYREYEFQFHTGSIKSDQKNAAIERLPRFQFHTGSIKSRRWFCGYRYF